MQEVETLLDHDYSSAEEDGPIRKKARFEVILPPGECIASKNDYFDVKPGRKYIEPPLDDVWPPPKLGGNDSQKHRVVDKLQALTTELKLNLSDVGDGTHSVLIQIPREQ